VAENFSSATVINPTFLFVQNAANIWSLSFLVSCSAASAKSDSILAKVMPDEELIANDPYLSAFIVAVDTVSFTNPS
jgi:hypothetical protein